MSSTITAGNATNGLAIASDNTGILQLKTGSGAGTTALTLDASQNATFAGTINGGGVLIPNAKLFRLDSALVGANVTTAQNVLGVGVTLAANTVYAFEAVYACSKTIGATSHSIGVGFGGTATLNNFLCYQAYSGNSSGLASTTTINESVTQNVSPLSVVTLASATSAFVFSIKGTVSVNAGGTFIPQYTLSAAPGGAYTTAAGSYFLIYPIGASGANTNVGGWA